jgi:hypothetical protein
VRGSVRSGPKRGRGGQGGDDRDLGRGVEGLEIPGGETEDVTRAAGDGAVALADEPVAVAAEGGAGVVGEAEREPGGDGGVDERDEPGGGRRAAAAAAQEDAEPVSEEERDEKRGEGAGGRAGERRLEDAGGQRRGEDETGEDRGGDEDRAQREEQPGDPAHPMAYARPRTRVYEKCDLRTFPGGGGGGWVISRGSDRNGYFVAVVVEAGSAPFGAAKSEAWIGELYSILVVT